VSELVTIKEAAARLGVSEDTIKRRLKRGELHGEKQERPQGFTWLIELPDDLPAPGGADFAGGGVSASSAEASELALLRERVAALERERDDAIDQRHLWHESFQDAVRRHEDESRASREAEGELRRLLFLAQQQAQALAAALPATTGEDERPAADHGHEEAGTTRPGFWSRLFGAG